MILSRLNENNIEYAVGLVMQNRDLLDLPPTMDSIEYSEFIQRKNETIPIWCVAIEDGVNVGIIGISGVMHGMSFIHVVVEPEHRGKRAFLNMFSLLELYASYDNYIPNWGLTTLPTNLAMQRAAINTGFFFAGTIDSPNKTGNKLYLYEMQNHLKFLFNKKQI